MLMLNFSNKKLAQKHLVQGINWNCIFGIGINILSINQFKVFNVLALRASVQVHQGSGPGSESRFLQVTLWIYMEITLRHRCSPINLLHILEHRFIRTPMEDCFCMFKLWFLCFCNSLILGIIWISIFFH